MQAAPPLSPAHLPVTIGEPESRALVRALGLWDVTAITAGTILGSAIFLAAAFVPREVPHADAGAAALGGGRTDRHRRRTDLRRTGNDVSRGGRAIPLHQAGLRSAVGLSLRVDLVAGDPGGSHRLPRRGVRRVSRRVRAVLLLDARDRVDSGGTMDGGSRTPCSSRECRRSRCCRR